MRGCRCGWLVREWVDEWGRWVSGCVRGLVRAFGDEGSGGDGEQEEEEDQARVGWGEKGKKGEEEEEQAMGSWGGGKRRTRRREGDEMAGKRT